MMFKLPFRSALQATLGLVLCAGGAFGQTGPYEFLWGAFGPREPSVDISGVPQITKGRVKVLYDWRAGAYPRIYQGTAYNGGVPEAADMQAHATKLIADIGQQIPDASFDGYAVLDYESWEIFWDDTDDTHKALSRQVARTKYPGATDAEIEAFAKRDFEAAAKTFILLTLNTAKQVRPNAKWGFYGYPRDFHVQHKDELGWLWQAAGAMYPSAYVVCPVAPQDPPTQGYSEQAYYPNHMRDLVGTARQLMGDRPVVPFAWCRVHTMNTVFGGQMLPDTDLRRMLREPRLKGADGVIFWEYFGDQTLVDQYSQYIPAHLRAAVADADAEFNPPPLAQGGGGSGHDTGDSGDRNGSGSQASGGSGGSNGSGSSGSSGSSGTPVASGGPGASSAGSSGGASGQGQSQVASNSQAASGGDSGAEPGTPPPPPGTEVRETSAGAPSGTNDGAQAPAKKKKVRKGPAFIQAKSGLAGNASRATVQRDVQTYEKRRWSRMFAKKNQQQTEDSNGTQVADVPTND